MRESEKLEMIIKLEDELKTLETLDEKRDSMDTRDTRKEKIKEEIEGIEIKDS